MARPSLRRQVAKTVVWMLFATAYMVGSGVVAPWFEGIRR